MATRRNADDRRQQEAGPPEGWKERRQHVERRQIGVIEISLQEWRFAWNRQSEPETLPASCDNPR